MLIMKWNQKQLKLNNNENIITLYKNEFYIIILYKKCQCQSELDLKIDQIECYTT